MQLSPVTGWTVTVHERGSVPCVDYGGMREEKQAHKQGLGQAQALQKQCTQRRTHTSHSHRTFHLGLIIRYDLLILLEFGG